MLILFLKLIRLWGSSTSTKHSQKPSFKFDKWIGKAYLEIPGHDPIVYADSYKADTEANVIIAIFEKAEAEYIIPGLTADDEIIWRNRVHSRSDRARAPTETKAEPNIEGQYHTFEDESNDKVRVILKLEAQAQRSSLVKFIRHDLEEQKKHVLFSAGTAKLGEAECFKLMLTIAEESKTRRFLQINMTWHLNTRIRELSV